MGNVYEFKFKSEPPPAPRLAEPHSETAEHALLGAILAKNALLDQVWSILDPEHFYFAFHGRLYAELARRIVNKSGTTPSLMREWIEADPDGKDLGLKFLFRLVEAVDSYNIVPHATVIRENWSRREIIRTAARLIEEANDPNAEIQEKCIALADQIDNATIEPNEAQIHSFDEAVDGAIAKSHAARNRGGVPALPLINFPKLNDEILLEPSKLTIIGAESGEGKAQPLDAKILMRDGSWKTMGSLALGDELASIDGAGSRVAAIFPRGDREVFRITFSDGRSTEVCGDHLWSLNHPAWLEPKVKGTDDVRKLLPMGKFARSLSVDTVSGHFGSTEVPVDPYVLGCLLGDGGLTKGTVRFTSADEEIVEEIQLRLGGRVHVKRVVGSYAYSLNQRYAPDPVMEPGCRHGRRYIPRVAHMLTRSLKELGVIGVRGDSKFIPEVYLQADRQTRLDLLRGLLDTDGWVDQNRSVRFTSKSLALSEGVRTLVLSLGGMCRISKMKASCFYKGERKDSITYRCYIRHNEGHELFLLKRKSEKARRNGSVARLTIRSIDPVGVKETRCIRVTHPSSLYVTDDYIVTHNSGLGFQIGVQTAEWVRGQWDQGLSVEAGGVAFVSLEMSKESLATRQLAAVSGLDSRRIARGSLTSFEYEQLESAKKRLTNLPIQVIDACGLTPTMIRMRLRQAQRRMMAKHKTKIGLVVIDHLQLVEAGAELSAQGGAWASAQVAKDILKIAKGFHSHVLALSQITSPAEEHREIDWRPTGKNLSWSKGFREAADNILILYRVEAHLPKTEPMMRTDESAEHLNERIEEWRKNHKDFHRKAELILEKVRDGRAGMVINLVFEATTTSFTEAIEAAPRWGA